MKKISEHENNKDDDEEEEDMPPRKKPLNKKECVNSLAALAVTILLEEVPSLQLLPDYAVILKHELGNKSLGKLDLLLTKLKEYSEIAVSMMVYLSKSIDSFCLYVNIIITIIIFFF